ncbi:MAG: diaminopimelate dehydrogenase [Clostridia bacterium]|nr:diaminopimelate dehydrogenase [Clostridia bacterium]
MSKYIRVGIVGYGNLGRGVELAIDKNPDMELVAIFSRRDLKGVIKPVQSAQVLNIKQAQEYREKIDVMILCGGSMTDLPEQTPYFSRIFNTVNSFDTHAKIPEHFDDVDIAAKQGKRLSLISAGWDPGLFSINRLITEAILPDGSTYTFWGRGVSQGHSDAIRRVSGVKDAVQYTVPIEDAMAKVRKGEQPRLSVGDRHMRDCYVVTEQGADKEKIKEQIQNMPNYFADYQTRVTFISQQELNEQHSGMPHGGVVIRSGRTGKENEHNHNMEFSLKLDSNPEFTGSVLVAYARAVYRMSQQGRIGAVTVFDIPPAYLSVESPEKLRRRLL